MKIEQVLAEAPKILRQEQREFYFENGYLLLDKFITGKRLQKLQDVTKAFVEKSRECEASNAMFDLEPDHTADAPRVRRLNMPYRQDPAYWELTSDSPITDVAQDLLGPNLKVHHSKLNFKWSDGGEEVKWHQDIPFYPHTNYGVLAIGIYLEDVDDEMGPMGVVPGSHKGEIFNHYNDKDQWVGALDEKDYGRVGLDKVVWLKGPAGSVTVHHCRMVHGSVPNVSPRGRPLLVNAYSAADALTVSAHPYPGPLADEIVRGKRARWVEYDSEPCLMPPDFSGGYSSIFAAQQEEDGSAAARSAQTDISNR